MYRNSGNIKTIPGLRRSNSSSNIPIRRSSSSTNLQVPQRRDSRSQSTSRCNTAVNRGGSALRNSKLSSEHGPYRLTSKIGTPLTAERSRSPFQSGRSKSPFQLGRSKSPYKTGAPKNKNFINDEYLKVRKFLNEDPTVDKEAIAKLKDLTTEVFTYLMNVLLQQIDQGINIDRNNYQTEVPAQLKVLEYPGYVSKTLFKSVNIKSNWPHIISMFGWLIELIITLNKPEENKEIFSGLQYFSEKYDAFNRGEDGSSADKKLIDAVDKYLGIDRTNYENQKKEIEELTEKSNQLQAQVTELEEETSNKRNFLEELKKKVEKLTIENSSTEERLNRELDSILEKRKAIAVRIQNVKDSIRKLEEVLSTQKYSIDDKKKVLKEIEDISYSIELKRQDLKSLKDIKDQFDYKLAETKREMEKEIARINREVRLCALHNPEYETLLLRNKGFFQKDFKNELQLFMDKKKVLEEETQAKLKHLIEEKESAQLEQNKFLASLHDINKEVDELKCTKNKIELKINKCREDYKEAVKQSEQMQLKFSEDILAMQTKEPDIKSAIAELEQLKLRKASLIQEHNVTEKRTAEVLTDLQETFVETFGEFEKMADIVTKAVDNKETEILKSEEEVEEKLKRFRERALLFFERISKSVTKIK